jgi:hypothetical protein
MSLQQTLTVFEVIDSAYVSGQDVVDLFAGYPAVTASTHRADGPKGGTDFVRITVPGSQGKSRGGADTWDYWPSGRYWCAANAYRRGI